MPPRAGGRRRALAGSGQSRGDHRGRRSRQSKHNLLQEKLKGGLPLVDRHQERLADAALGPIGYVRANLQSMA